MITFPPSPTTGQLYLADNTVTYQWTGDRWSALAAMVSGQSYPVIDGKYADSTQDAILDGGTA
jgi:hypothetical protein